MPLGDKLIGRWKVNWTAPFYPVRPAPAKDLVLKDAYVEIKDIDIADVRQTVVVFDDKTNPQSPIKVTIELELKADGSYETGRGYKIMGDFVYDFSARTDGTEITALTIRRIRAEDSGGQWGGNK